MCVDQWVTQGRCHWAGFVSYVPDDPFPSSFCLGNDADVYNAEPHAILMALRDYRDTHHYSVVRPLPLLTTFLDTQVALQQWTTDAAGPGQILPWLKTTDSANPEASTELMSGSRGTGTQ